MGRSRGKNRAQACPSRSPLENRCHRSRARLPIGYRKHCPRPTQGRGRSAGGAGGVGSAGERCMGIPLRGDWRGVSSPGRGQAPSSVPSPRRDIHHGPVHVGTLEKSRIRLPTGYTHARLFPDIASTAPLPEGGGRGEGAGEAYGYPLRVSRREAYGYPPAGRGNLPCSGTTPVNPGKNPAPTPGRPRYFRTVTKKPRFGVEERGDFRAFPSPGARGTIDSFSCGS